MMRHSRSIKRTLMTLILLTSGIVLLLACGTFLTHEILTYRQSMVTSVSTLARVVASNSTAALAFENPSDARDVLSALAAEPHIQSAALYREGTLFATYPGAASPDRFPAHPERDTHRFSSTDLVLFQTVTQNGRPLGTLYLQMDLGALHDRFVIFGELSLITIVITSLVAFVVSSRLQRQISRPVLALAETAHIVSERGDYSHRAERFGQDELGQLTDAFNKMLAHVEEQDASLRAQGDLLRHEVGERTRAEAEVRALNTDLERRVADRTEALAAANRELEAFSYSVSHDLRAPLRHVSGFVELLQKESEGQLSERGQRYIQTIKRASVDMGQLIDDLLAFSRTTRSELTLGDVALDTLVTEIIQSLEPASSGRAIAWERTPLPVVVGDQALLRQVFTNLLDNAVKYTRPRNPARIAVGCHEAQNGHAVVFVRDNGAGFDMRYAQKLFGVFQRLHRSEEFEGTGIGLATVQRIVARHGGRVWAESAINEGSTFFVSLPTASSASGAAS
jgi:signal transduction histidine kinase